MIKSHKLKIYGNKEKLKRLDNLIEFWKEEVNRKIRLFWDFESVIDSYPPKEYTKGGRIIRDASVKAWQIVKGTKKTKQKDMPIFKGNEIDLNEASAKLIEGFETKEFDLWFNVISLEKWHRLKLPCKKYEKLNDALEKGKLKKSFKVLKENGDFYIQVFIDIPEVEPNTNKIVGIDVGLNNAVATSDGQFFGEDLKDLRIRTKWRKYDGMSAFKQGLNRIVKELIKTYSGCSFAVERLLFKGKRKRSRRFRRNNLNWSYGHLSRRLSELGQTEGFSLYEVNPRNTSRECPVCGFTDKKNRQGETFKCKQCGFIGHSDIVGSCNIAERVFKDFPYLRAECSSINCYKIGGV